MMMINGAAEPFALTFAFSLVGEEEPELCRVKTVQIIADGRPLSPSSNTLAPISRSCDSCPDHPPDDNHYKPK
jgi:hypothetical protein